MVGPTPSSFVLAGGSDGSLSLKCACLRKVWTTYWPLVVQYYHQIVRLPFWRRRMGSETLGVRIGSGPKETRPGSRTQSASGQPINRGQLDRCTTRPCGSDDMRGSRHTLGVLGRYWFRIFQVNQEI